MKGISGTPVFFLLYFGKQQSTGRPEELLIKNVSDVRLRRRIFPSPTRRHLEHG